MKLGTVFFSLVFLAAAQAHATSCSPVDNSARILASPDPGDIHPDWSGESSIGTSWSVVVDSQVDTDDGSFLKGDLISPRGELVTPGVYIIEDEWDCE